MFFWFQGQAVLQHNLDQWQEIVKTREFLPESIEKMFDGKSVCKVSLKTIFLHV